MKVLFTVEKERHILHRTRRMKDNWFGHILRRNFLQKYTSEGKTEERIDVTGEDEEEVSRYRIT
jgi:hypothetical protein